MILGMNAAEEAGKLIHNLPELWKQAIQSEKHKIISTVLDAVYVDAKQFKTVVSIKPGPPLNLFFRWWFLVKTLISVLFTSPEKAHLCFW